MQLHMLGSSSTAVTSSASNVYADYMQQQHAYSEMLRQAQGLSGLQQQQQQLANINAVAANMARASGGFGSGLGVPHGVGLGPFGQAMVKDDGQGQGVVATTAPIATPTAGMAGMAGAGAAFYNPWFQQTVAGARANAAAAAAAAAVAGFGLQFPLAGAAAARSGHQLQLQQATITRAAAAAGGLCGVDGQ